MKFKFAPSLIAIALAAPAAATPGSVRDFQLQPSPTPTATPQVQGPVDVEAGVPIGPRVIPTGTPSTAPAPSPSPTPAAASSPTPASTSANKPAPRATSTAAPQPRRTAAAPPEAAASPAPVQSDSASAADFSQSSPPAPLPTQPAPIEAQSGIDDSTSNTSYIFWIALFTGLVIAIGGAFVFWRRRKPAQASAPEIESPGKWVNKTQDSADLPPLQRATPEHTPQTAGQSGIAEPSSAEPLITQAASKSSLQIKAQALSLSRSLMNATLSYRLELVNMDNRPIGDVSVKADLVTAHGQAPVSQQIADDSTVLTESAFVASIDGRETHEVKGSFSLPVGSIRPITQRGAALYVPLLRLRVDAANMDPIICTFVVGIQPHENGGKLQPFRLDELAQTYRNIGLRLLD